MTINEIKKILEKTGLPVAYRTFDTPQNLPFIRFYSPNNNDFFADGINFLKIEVIRIELYTKKKDLVLEKKVEKMLACFAWQKTELYVETEKMYQIIYEFEV